MSEPFFEAIREYRQREIDGALALLGMPSLRQTLRSDLDVHDWLMRGLPVRCLHSLLKKSTFSESEFAGAVAISPQRVRRLLAVQSGGRLSPAESLAIWQFARVFDSALATMGSTAQAKDWLQHAAPRGTNYRHPVEFVALAPGAEYLLNLLGRLRHGVFS